MRRAARGLILWLAALALAAPAAARPVAPPEAELEALYPEGPVVIDGDLYIAEMSGHRVRRFTLDAEGRLKGEVFFARPGCGPTALAALDAERIVALCHLEGALAVLDRDGALLSVISRSTDGVRLDTPNDISADGRGGAYFSNAGRFFPGAEARGRVMRIAPDLSVVSVADGLAYANGVATDAARGRLLVSEHLARRVWAYPILPEGGLGAREPLIAPERLEALAESDDPLMGPDGIEIAPDGTARVALYGAGRYLRLDPDGTLTAHPAKTRYLCNLALWRGRLALAGAFDNTAWPLPGLIEIRALEKEKGGG